MEDSIFEKNKISSLRNYKEFKFNNSEFIEKNKLLQLQYSLRKLKTENDTINGIKIHFGEKTNYAVFVNVLNILIIEEIEIYCPYQNDIWVLVRSKPKYDKLILLRTTCGYYEANKEYLLEEERKAERIKQFKLFRKYWILYLGYLGIVFLNIFTLLKFHKSQKSLTK